MGIESTHIGPLHMIYFLMLHLLGYWTHNAKTRIWAVSLNYTQRKDAVSPVGAFCFTLCAFSYLKYMLNFVIHHDYVSCIIAVAFLNPFFMSSIICCFRKLQ